MSNPTADDEIGGLRELAAMRKCAAQLELLDPDARQRALNWLNGAYWVEPAYTENGQST